MTRKVWEAEDVTMAADLAAYVHRGQKYGDAPYQTHLRRVAALVKSFGPIAEIVGWLHDSIEDTDLAPETIDNLFDDQIRDSVEFLSDPKGKSRKERKAEINRRFAEKTWGPGLMLGCKVWPAFIVKAADRYDNISNCIRDRNADLLAMYRAEQPEFEKAVKRVENAMFFDSIATLLKYED